MGTDKESPNKTKASICYLSLVVSVRNAEGNSVLSASGFHPNSQSQNSESLIIHAQYVWAHFELHGCEEELNHRIKNTLSWKRPTGIHEPNSWQYFCNSIPIALIRDDLPWCRGQKMSCYLSIGHFGWFCTLPLAKALERKWREMPLSPY